MGNQYSQCRQVLSDRFMSLLTNKGRSSCSCDKEEESERPCSLNPWPNLANDLIVEILCRLPEKPLIRFKSVSKDWHFLISKVCVPKISPAMPLSGLLFHEANVFFGFRYNIFMDYAPYPPSPSHVRSCSALFHFDHTLYDLQDCCNGLLLFVRRSSCTPAEYYVCNPVTKQRVAIPTNPTHVEAPTFAALAFNASESLNYKIVRISNPPKLDVFSSDTGKWVTHALSLDPAVYGFKRVKRGAYFNGVLYMLSGPSYLVSFDIKTGNNVSGRAIELPEKDTFDYRGGCIGVSKGCFYYSNYDRSELCIWSLHGGEEWIFRHKISLKRLLLRLGFVAALPPLGNKLCAFHPTREMIFIGEPKMILSYHLHTKQLELLVDMRNARYLLLGGDAIFTYSHCLLLLNKFSIHK